MGANAAFRAAKWGSHCFGGRQRQVAAVVAAYSRLMKKKLICSALGAAAGAGAARLVTRDPLVLLLAGAAGVVGGLIAAADAPAAPTIAPRLPSRVPEHIVAARAFLGWGYCKGVDDERQLIGCSKFLLRTAQAVGVDVHQLDPGAIGEGVLARFVVKHLRPAARRHARVGDVALFVPSRAGDPDEAHVALVDADANGRLVLLHACEACGGVTNCDPLDTRHPGGVVLLGFAPFPRRR